MEKSQIMGDKFKDLRPNCIINISEFLDHRTFIFFSFMRSKYKSLLRMDLHIIKLYKLFSIKSKVEFIREKLRYLQNPNPKITKSNDLILKYLTSSETLEFLEKRFNFTLEQIFFAGKLYIIELLNENFQINVTDIKFFSTLKKLNDIYQSFYQRNFNFTFNPKQNVNLEEIRAINRIDSFEIPNGIIISDDAVRNYQNLLDPAKENSFTISKLVIENCLNQSKYVAMVDLELLVDHFQKFKHKLTELKLSLEYCTIKEIDSVLKIIELNENSLRKIIVNKFFLEKKFLSKILKQLKNCSLIHTLIFPKIENFDNTRKQNFIKLIESLNNVDLLNIAFHFETVSKFQNEFNEILKLVTALKSKSIDLELKIVINSFRKRDKKLNVILENISQGLNSVLDSLIYCNMFDLEEINDLTHMDNEVNVKFEIRIDINFNEKHITGFQIKLGTLEGLKKISLRNYSTTQRYLNLAEVSTKNPKIQKFCFVNCPRSFGVLSNNENSFTLKIRSYQNDYMNIANSHIQNFPKDSYSVYMYIDEIFDTKFMKIENWINYTNFCLGIRYLNILPAFGYNKTEERELIFISETITLFKNLEFLSLDYHVVDENTWIKFSNCLVELKSLKFLYLLFNTTLNSSNESFNDNVVQNFLENIQTKSINFISFRGKFTDKSLEHFKKNIDKIKYLTEFNIKGKLKISLDGVKCLDYILEKTYFIANVLIDIDFEGEKQDNIVAIKKKISELELKYNRTFTIYYNNN